MLWKRKRKVNQVGDRYTRHEIRSMKIKTMAKLDRITINPEVMNGQPCIRQMRITVRRILEALRVTPDWQILMAEYPGIEEEDIRQALAWAAYNLDDQLTRLGAA